MAGLMETAAWGEFVVGHLSVWNVIRDE